MKASNAIDRPWLDRYLKIIASMLPEGKKTPAEPPFQQIARFVTAGKNCHLPGSIDAFHGLEVCRGAWHAMGELSSNPSQAKSVFDRIIHAQSPNGRILPATADDHPESVWYSELQLAHALATAGLILKNDGFIAAAQSASHFILNEIQPDHATNRPWGLNAFLLSEETLPLADWMLHSTTVHLMTGDDPITLLLLQDCIYSFTS